MQKDELAPPPMKASDLVSELTQIIERHGDLPVLLNDDSPVRQVCPYDSKGNTRGKMVEIVLHGWGTR